MRLVFYNLRLWLSNQTKDLLNLDEQIKYILYRSISLNRHSKLDKE